MVLSRTGIYKKADKRKIVKATYEKAEGAETAKRQFEQWEFIEPVADQILHEVYPDRYADPGGRLADLRARPASTSGSSRTADSPRAAVDLGGPPPAAVGKDEVADTEAAPTAGRNAAKNKKKREKAKQKREAEKGSGEASAADAGS